MTPTAEILVGDVRERLADLPDESVHLCMTSPPYFNLRDYGTGRWEGGSEECDHKKPTSANGSTLECGKKTTGHAQEGYRSTCPKCGAVRIDQQMGLESQLDCLSWATGAEPCRACWICSMRDTFAAVRRVLRRDGVMWVNVGDSYAQSTTRQRGWNTGSGGDLHEGVIDNSRSTVGGAIKPKDMCLAPSRLALALQADGWYVRSIAPWVKRSSMPQSVTDRPSTSLEWMLMLTREARYFWDVEAVRRGTTPDSRDARWGATKQTSRHGHEADAEQGMMLTRTQADGYVRMSNPAGRYLRDSDWWFDSVGMLLRDEVLGFDVVSEPSSDAHYASYPRRLVRDVVLAGSSGAGVCGECGAPWLRCVERSPMEVRPGPSREARLEQGLRTHTNGTMTKPPESQTIGFRPSCTHTALRRPATVLDPFCGRGTTGVVALEYGRSFIGIELSEAYAAMARRRLAAVECQPLLDVTAPEPAPRAEQIVMEVD